MGFGGEVSLGHSYRLCLGITALVQVSKVGVLLGSSVSFWVGACNSLKPLEIYKPKEFLCNINNPAAMFPLEKLAFPLKPWGMLSGEHRMRVKLDGVFAHIAQKFGGWNTLSKLS